MVNGFVDCCALSANDARVRSRSPSPQMAWATPSGSPLRAQSAFGAPAPTGPPKELQHFSETTFPKARHANTHGKSKASSSKSKSAASAAPPEASAENVLTDDAHINADVEYIRHLFPQYHIDDIRMKLFEHYDHKHRIEVPVQYLQILYNEYKFP